MVLFLSQVQQLFRHHIPLSISVCVKTVVKVPFQIFAAHSSAWRTFSYLQRNQLKSFTLPECRHDEKKKVVKRSADTVKRSTNTVFTQIYFINKFAVSEIHWYRMIIIERP